MNAETGVLAKISTILAKCGISIVEIAQKCQEVDETKLPLVVITHVTNEHAIKNAVAKISASNCATVRSVIRVENQ